MRFGSLFAGIGGIDLGLERAGMKCLWQVELDPYCQSVLAKHWPEVRRYGDIREVTELEYVDLIAGGFPCQPVSVAGARRGIDDERWLWPEFLQVLRMVRPQYVLVENVPGLLSGGEWKDERNNMCICGWPYRWGGLYLYTEHQQESALYACNRDSNVSSSDQNKTIPYSKARRKNKEARQCKSQSSRVMELVYSGQTMCQFTQRDSRLSFVKERTSRFGNTPAGYDRPITTTQEWECEMDGRSNQRWENNQDFDRRIKHEGATKRELGGRMVCPSCGRYMDYSTTKHVYRSWMGRILYDLAALGYDAEWGCLSAAAVGAPHRRDRVFIIACHQSQSQVPHSNKQHDNYRRHGTSTIFGQRPQSVELQKGEQVANPESISQRESADETNTKPDCRQTWEKSCSRSWWSVEPDVGRVAHGIPSRVDRLRGLGNAVVPQVAEWIGREILSANKQQKEGGPYGHTGREYTTGIGLDHDN